MQMGTGHVSDDDRINATRFVGRNVEVLESCTRLLAHLSIRISGFKAPIVSKEVLAAARAQQTTARLSPAIHLVADFRRILLERWSWDGEPVGSRVLNHFL